MVENNQNPVTEVSEQGAVQATVESVNNGMIPQGSATPDSNSSANQTDILNKESAKTMKKEDNHPSSHSPEYRSGSCCSQRPA